MLEVVLLAFALTAASLMTLSVIADFLPPRTGTDLDTYTIGTFLVLVLFGMAARSAPLPGERKGHTS
jgi:hypothetical protein